MPVMAEVKKGSSVERPMKVRGTEFRFKDKTSQVQVDHERAFRKQYKIERMKVNCKNTKNLHIQNF